MDYLRLRAIEYNPYYVEAIGVPRSPEAPYPVPRGCSHLPLLPPVHRRQWTAVTRRDTRLDLDERDQSAGPVSRRSFRHEIDVAVSAPKASADDVPSPRDQPALRDLLAALTQSLPCRQHVVEASAGGVGSVTKSSPAESLSAERSPYCLGPQILSRSSRPARTSRGLEPSGGPRMPAECSWSMIRAARPYPTLSRRCSSDVEPC